MTKIFSIFLFLSIILPINAVSCQVFKMNFPQIQPVMTKTTSLKSKKKHKKNITRMIIDSQKNINLEDIKNEISKLIQETEEIYGTDFCTIGFKYKNLKTNSTFGYDTNTPHVSRQVGRIPLMVFLHKLFDENKLNLDKIIKVKEEDISNGTGNIKYYADLGIFPEYNIRDLISKIMIEHDKTAYNILMNLFGEENLIAYLSENKLIENEYKFGPDLYLSCNDSMRCLEELNEIINKKSEFSSLITNNFSRSRQLYNDKIPAGIDNYQILHNTETAANLKFSSDEAIIPGEYILVIKTTGIKKSKQASVFRKLSFLINYYHDLENKIESMV
ncbi:MAG: serine hydrolase [Candidatus Improbicoccus devescovinae]|nr:MAG: serine hydrolase [Candidatus Improbicoccus devescovinae]